MAKAAAAPAGCGSKATARGPRGKSGLEILEKWRRLGFINRATIRILA